MSTFDEWRQRKDIVHWEHLPCNLFSCVITKNDINNFSNAYCTLPRDGHSQNKSFKDHIILNRLRGCCRSLWFVLFVGSGLLPVSHHKSKNQTSWSSSGGRRGKRWHQCCMLTCNLLVGSMKWCHRTWQWLWWLSLQNVRLHCWGIKGSHNLFMFLHVSLIFLTLNYKGIIVVLVLSCCR